jgi:hypothetical protein
VTTISHPACRHQAEHLRELCAGTYDHWEVVGTVRREKPGHDVEHLVRPLWGPARADDGGNLVWRRLLELSTEGGCCPCDGGRFWPAAESQVVELQAGAHKHTLYCGTLTNWGMLLARRTGPIEFWSMLERRLQAEGTLKIHGGNVCCYTAVHQWVPIECPDEREFFRLARTVWREPNARRPWAAAMWELGMTPPYYPEFITPVVDPTTAPHLFTHSKPARRRQRSSDHGRGRA